MSFVIFQAASRSREDPYLYSLLKSKNGRYTIQNHDDYSEVNSSLKKIVKRIKRFFDNFKHKILGRFSAQYRRRFILKAGEILMHKHEAEVAEFRKIALENRKKEEKQRVENLELQVKKRVEKVANHWWRTALSKALDAKEKRLEEDFWILTHLQQLKGVGIDLPDEFLSRLEYKEPPEKTPDAIDKFVNRLSGHNSREEEKRRKDKQDQNKEDCNKVLGVLEQLREESQFLEESHGLIERKAEEYQKRKNYLQELRMKLNRPFVSKVKEGKRTPSARVSLKEKMLIDIGTHIHKDFQEVWEILFSKLNVKRWECSDENFTLTLHEEAKIWVNTKDEKGEQDPKGGSVFLLAKTITGKFIPGEKKIVFKKGVENRCKHPFLPGNITVNTYYVTYFSADRIDFQAGLPIKKEIRSQTLSLLKENWGQLELVSNPDQVIEEKLGG